MKDNGVRKNYGGRMIFGDEKLLRSSTLWVCGARPRCALAFGSGRLTGGYAVRGSARPSPKLLPSVATSHTRQPLYIESLKKKEKWLGLKEAIIFITTQKRKEESSFHSIKEIY